MGGIYLIQKDGELIELKEQPYDSEAYLQDLLARYPSLLAGDQMETEQPRRWLLIDREMGLAAEDDGSDRWSVDHLFLDQEGIPTIVEVKRSSDTRIRREVIGQMLDYAANGVKYWPLDLNHGWLNDLPQSEKCRAVFLEELNKIPGLSIRTDSFRPRVSIETWGPVVDMFLAAVRRVISTGTEKL